MNQGALNFKTLNFKTMMKSSQNLGKMMPKSYRTRNEATEVTFNEVTLNIRNLYYAKLESSVWFRLYRFLGESIMTLVFLIGAGVIMFFGLNNVTIDCERNANEPNTYCSVIHENYFRANKTLIKHDPIRSIEIVNNSGYTCNLEVVNSKHQVISPMGGMLFSSGICGFHSEIKPVQQLVALSPDQTSSEKRHAKVTLSNNLFLWLGLIACLLISAWMIKSLVLEGYLIQLTLDNRNKTINMRYVRPFDTVERTYKFDEVVKAVYEYNEHSKKPAKQAHFLFKDGKKRDIDFSANENEINKIVIHINTYMAKT